MNAEDVDNCGMSKRSEKIPWIKEIGEISTASEKSLRASLITPDGRGCKLKEHALDELLKRNNSNKNIDYE